MPKRIAINGFGRIGRISFREAITRKNLLVVAINDLTDPTTLAYLLKYDSVYGKFPGKVSATKNALVVNGKTYPVFAEKEPQKLPWKKLKVDVVLECTGFFTEKEGAQLHRDAGAKQVIISAPTKSEDVVTAVCGVNHEKAKGQKIISNASCTTNCVSPVMAVLHDAFGVEKGIMSTIHAYTATQKLVDGPDAKDLRRGRAAAENVSPSTTGAAIAATKTIPALVGKFDGIAIRVPVPAGSLTDFVCVLKKNVTVEQVNAAFVAAAKKPRFKGILEATNEQLVSRDILGTTASAIVDLSFTRVVGGNLVKVLAWYDNEWAYSIRLVDMISHV